MADLKEKIYGVIKNYQLTSLATLTDDGKPWVRYCNLFAKSIVQYFILFIMLQITP